MSRHRKEALGLRGPRDVNMPKMQGGNPGHSCPMKEELISHCGIS